VALELSEAALVAGVAVAIDHPTQDNWVTVGGDALAIATGYAVGKVIIGPALRAVARKLAQREAQLAAAEIEAAAAAEAEQASAAAAKAKADKIAANKAKQASPEAQAAKAARGQKTTGRREGAAR